MTKSIIRNEPLIFAGGGLTIWVWSTSISVSSFIKHTPIMTIFGAEKLE